MDRRRDNNFAIFKADSPIVYKQILLPDEIELLNTYFMNQLNDNNNNKSGGIATGRRLHVDVCLKSLFVDICERLSIVLRDYFPDLQIDPNGRFYNHQYGGVKPHKDGCHDGKSNYTLLLYITEGFDDGRLSIKMKRTDDEIQQSEQDKFHKVFTFNQRKGYGVIFKKDLLHWANDNYVGDKNFLLIHLYSAF